MITLEKNTDDWFIRDCCSSCHKKGKIYVITIWHTDINGTSICLCRDCLNKLKKEIEKILSDKDIKLIVANDCEVNTLAEII